VLAPRITRWHLASLPGPRAASAEDLERNLRTVEPRTPAEKFPSPAEALAAALERAEEGDKIVVFGSFLTVGEAMSWLKNNNKTSKR
jgi:dihydrofolate synthase / folylpolyglutamate synthase